MSREMKCECKGCEACEEGDCHAGAPPEATKTRIGAKAVRYYGPAKEGHERAHGVRKRVPIYADLCDPCAALIRKATAAS